MGAGRILGIVLLLAAGLLARDAPAATLAETDIAVLGIAVDLDTRPDLDGIQTSMTAVRNVPSGVLAFVGGQGIVATPASLPGARVKAELTGPALGSEVVTLQAVPGQLMELPPLGAAGEYRLYNVRLEDGAGNVVLRRDPSLDAIVINVIEELLVTQVVTRPLTLAEIIEKGIVIDEDNYTVLNFSIGLTLGSEQVQIELPVAVPKTEQAGIGQVGAPPQFTTLPSVRGQFDGVSIPNFSLTGFQMLVPPELEQELKIRLPAINGVIIIPGNIAFLNQFFSVVLQATNVAPAGSGLALLNASAQIALPAGEDDIKGSGDDPLRVAETQGGGVQEVLPLLHPDTADTIQPSSTNNAEFLVEGLREGAHVVNFDITGDLFVPALGETVPLTGAAAGVVQVKNPSFDIVLAHPDVVREGEAYSLFATVTNTSSNPANLFRLKLDARRLTGARLEDGETGLKTLDTLAPGQAETFEFHLVARTTGEVTGTVFLADEGINGSFILTTGVGDTGIPLSPDTLVLPQTVDYLPDEPDLVFAAVRMLGQAYSVATAPAGALPPEIARIRRSYVFDRAVKVAQAGLHVRFGETGVRATQDILMDYFGADRGRLDVLYPDAATRSKQLADMQAFDGLRRAADAGNDLSAVFGELIGQALAGSSLPQLQLDWAEAFASRPPHLSFGISSQGPPALLQLSDADGNRLGRLAADADLTRDIPFADHLPLSDADGMLFIAAPRSPEYLLEFTAPAAADFEPALILPAAGGGMEQVIYPSVNLPDGATARLRWKAGAANDYLWEIDLDGDGVTDQTLPPDTVLPVDDPPPGLLGIHQWGKGAQPGTGPTFAAGDPIGRMAGVLFSEEVDGASAAALTAYEVIDNRIVDVSLQPDRRLAFVITEKPVGPFVPRQMTVAGVRDRASQEMAAESLPIVPDPDRGTGGTFTGHILTADGRPVPFATVKYIQPLSFKSLFSACFADLDVKDFVIAEYLADARGRFRIDYVLQSGFPSPGCPSNADIWLNEAGAGGTINFKLEATDPETGNVGRASSRIQFDGQRMNFDVIIRGFGNIEGRVFDEAGNPASGGDPDSGSELYVFAQNVSTGGAAVSWVDAAGRYAFPRAFTSAAGVNFDAPGVPSGNVILRIVRPADGATAIASINIPFEGATVEQDLVLVDPSRYGAVTGRVLEADGVTGAASVPVQVGVVSGSSNSVVGATVTDSEGFYSFNQVPAGDIEVRAVRQSTFEQARVRSFLFEGETRDLVLIFPGGGGTVRGLVRDAFGNPIANATVAGGPTLTTTDENGFFEITGLPLGSFTIFGQGSGSLALGQVQVDTLGPDDIQDVVITLQPTGSITGTVYEADGVTPIVGQKVQLWVGNRGVLAETFSASGGAYRFPDFPLGEYSIRAVRGDGGDGGMAVTALRYAGDERDADIVFRGLGEIKGRVIQSNGTPVLSDVIITRKVWRIVTDPFAEIPNVYLDFIKELANVNEELEQTVDRVLTENNLNQGPAQFFFLVDEPVLLKSDILGPNGEVTGEFHFTGPATGGPFTVAAFGPFLSPTVVTGEIPKTANPAERIVDVGDIVLEPATGRVRGTVYLPDGQTPVGENVLVKLRSLSGSGKILVPGGSIEQPVLPEIDVLTDANGQYEFPLALRGNFVLSVDTGAPDPAIRADTPGEMQTEVFADAAGERLLNVRLYGQATGVVPLDDVVTVDVRLQDVGGVQVQVVQNDGQTAVPFAEVSLATAASLDAAAESQFQNLVADANGMIDFFPVIEGMFSVSAREPASPAKGQANGNIPVNPPNGFVTPVKVTLGAVTTASGEVIAASIFGAVEGTVLAADGTPLENPSQVTVAAAGIQILTTSDASGHYRADNVPGGFFRVEAFEPFTARRGSAAGSITFDGQTVTVPVMLAGLGTVTGEVLSNDGSRMISAVDVELMPSGNFTERLFSRTNNQGIYSLPGVPVGSYQVTAADPDSGLAGAASGRMEQDGATVTTDIYLEPSGEIAGTVYAPGVLLDADGRPVDGSGAPLPNAPVAANASVSVGGRVVQTGADGRFASGPYLRMGNYSLTARSLSGNDGASATTALTYDGQLAEVPMALRGNGTIEGIVLNSTGDSPVVTAQVTLHSKSPFAGGAVTRFTEADGGFRFDAVPVGDFSLSVRTTLEVPQLGAGVSSSLAAHGDTIGFLDGDADAVHNAIRLQQAGGLTGQVLLSDGTTFAEGAVVELNGNGLQLARIADPGGVFLFEGVPLGAYQLMIREPASNGVAARRVELAVNGEVIELGSIILDNTRPVVTDRLPKADSTGINPTVPILVYFNELIDPATVSPATFQVLVDGEPVTGSYTVSPIEPLIAFAPSQRLPDLRQIQVVLRGERLGFEGQVLEAGIRDLAGQGMVADVSYRFMTGDSVPPSVVSLSPAAGSSEVSLASVVRFEFSEPVSRSSITGFTLGNSSGPVAGTLNQLPILADRVFVFTPAAPLLPNENYTATMAGPLADLAGNSMQEAAVTTTFRTLDTLAPVIDALTVPSGTVFSVGGVISVTAVSGDTDIASVEFYINNSLVATQLQAPYATPVYLAPELGSSAVIGAIATDEAGNRSALASLPVVIGANQPPAVSIVSPESGTVSIGAVVTVRVRASDDIGLSQLSYSANAGVVAAGSKLVSSTVVEETFTFAVPTDLEEGDSIILRAAARDSLGLVAESAQVSLTVQDLLPPTVTITSPANNSVVSAGANVSVAVRADDGSGIERLVLETAGALVTSQERLFDPATSPAVASFTVALPADAPAAQGLIVTVRAFDTAGNERSRSINLQIRDVTAPAVSVATPDGNNGVSPGTTATVSVTATDNVGATRVELFVDGASVAVRNTTAAPVVEETFSIDVPASLPVGGQLSVLAVADDAAGNRGESAPLVLVAGDLTAPVVTIVAPADGSEVLPGADFDVQVTASDTIGVASLGLTLGGAVSGTDAAGFTPQPGEVGHTFTVSVPADAAAEALITIDVTATDGAGLTGVAGITVRVADTVPPEVTLTAPVHGATNVPVSTRPSATFSEALDPATVSTTTVTLATLAGQAVDSQVVLSQDARTITVVPDADLAFGTAYRLTLTTALADVAGNPLAAAVNTEFTTDSGDLTAPRLLELVPADAAVDVSVMPLVRARFDEAVDPATVTAGAFRLRDAGGTDVSTVTGFADNNRDVLLELQAPLEFGAVYRVELAGTITDEAGNAIVDAAGQAITTLVHSFTTGNFAIIRPAEGDRVLENSEIVLEAGASDGFGLVDVVFEVNGVALPAVTTAPYQMVYTVPSISVANTLEITAIARDAGAVELARASVTVNVVPGLTADPRLLGVPLGGSRAFSLRLSTPLATDLTVQLSTTATDILALPGAEIIVPAGATEVPVSLGGLAEGAGTILFLSDQGGGGVIASVSATESGVELLAHSQAVGMALNPAPRLDSIVVPVTGSYTLAMPLLAAPATGQLTVSVSSSDPAIADVTGPVVIEAGSQVGVFELVTGANGTAILRLVIDGKVYELAVVVGSTARSGVNAQAVGLAVQPALQMNSLVVPTAGSQTVVMPLLAAPAGTQITVGVSSSDPAIADVTGPVVIEAGSQVGVFELVTGANGTAILRLVIDGKVYELAVVVGSTARSGVNAQAVGLAVLPALQMSSLVVPTAGSQTLVMPLLAVPAGSQITVGVSSSDPAIADVTGPVVIEAGSQVGVFELVTGANGTAILRLVIDGKVYELAVVVGSTARSGVNAQAVGLAVQPGGTAGTLFIDPSSSLDIVLPLLGVPAAADVFVDLLSRNSLVADVNVSSAVIAAGSGDVAFTIIAGALPGETLIDLFYDDKHKTLRVVVGKPADADRPLTIAPVLGIEVQAP